MKRGGFSLKHNTSLREAGERDTVSMRGMGSEGGVWDASHHFREPPSSLNQKSPKEGTG